MEILHLARCKNCKQVFGILRRTMLTQQRCKEPSAYSGRQQHLFSHWYDTDGERTVKTSGENEAIYVNSEFSGGNPVQHASRSMSAHTSLQGKVASTPSTSTSVVKELFLNWATWLLMVQTQDEYRMQAMKRMV